ncbi:MAG: PSD1 and planctomycete cytochrome C domain-containing protein [Rubripirellula sp.]
MPNSLAIRTFFGLPILCLAAWIPCKADELSFNRDIRPILSDACFFCHGPDSAHREADLRLDVEASAKEHAIVPGEIEDSEVIARILETDPDLQMPPPESGKKLTKSEIDLLTRWVKEGAKYEPYWAYVAPQPHPVPKVDSHWPSDPIDNFVFQQLRSLKMQPSKDAAPGTLLRRVSYDLTGLPPTPKQVASFLADPSPLAYREYVDHLLESPAFGERMSIYWLDLVRFADTVGYHGDQDHNVSPYRDYVIDAFNEDMPLDQFTREQLAGDLLPNPTQSQRIATCYNRLLQTSHEGGVQPKEYLAIYAADRIRNLSAVWMGATVGCAQCHDHKYDPYSIDNFYQMSAFFADIDEQQHFKVGTNSLPTKRPPEIPVLSRWQSDWLDSLSVEIDGLKARLDRESGNRKSRQQISARIDTLNAQRESIEKSTRMTMITEAIEPREVRVLPRGNWLDENGTIVTPSVPDFLGRIQTGDRRATRLDLANWLVDEKQGVGGLTARVFVNRFWYLMFGRGISSSLADFGGQGEPPTHPELLDQLAIDFVKDQWSTKRLMRRLVLTRTYRQSSDTSPEQLANDPYNRWFGRQSRYRLPAEAIRDQALSLSRLMVSDVGGASVKPHQPAGYYRHLNFPTRLYQPDRDDRQYRRGVYMHWQRQFLHPMLKSMDAPSREECTAQRPRSNTPLEALVMLNDPSMVDAAIALASRLLNESGLSDRDRIQQGFRWAVIRDPDDSELQALERLLANERKHYIANSADAQTLIESADKSVPIEGTDRIELAAWTSIARTLLNMYETVTRN